MQPTPSRRMPEPEANAVSRTGRPPSLNHAGRADAHGEVGAPAPLAADGSPDPVDGRDGTLDEVARREREEMRPRLRDELGREPTEEELDEWLRRHTEGY